MSLVSEFGLHSSLQPVMAYQETALNRRAAELRAKYGAEGKVVYDRLDRWREEHRRCDDATDHEGTVEHMIYVIHCRAMDAVAVCESWQFSTVYSTS